MQLASTIEKALHNVKEEKNADILFHSEQELLLGISLYPLPPPLCAHSLAFSYYYLLHSTASLPSLLSSFVFLLWPYYYLCRCLFAAESRESG
jgi:hypothetical protein